MKKSSTKSTTDTEAADTPNIEITDATVFYWTEGGAKLHLFTDCQALSKSEPSKIKQGLLENAYYAGKTEPCSFCLKNANLTADNFPSFLPSAETSNETTVESTEEQITSFFDTDMPNETTPNDEAIYIWTKSGTKLHLFESCTHLSKTPEENKLRGNKEAAMEYGISEICSRCQKNAQDTD